MKAALAWTLNARGMISSLRIKYPPRWERPPGKVRYVGLVSSAEVVVAVVAIVSGG